MYDVIGRLVFDAAVASLFSEVAGADGTLYPAFSVFDSFLPLAVAGIPIKHLRNGKEARDHLYKAIHQYKEGVSDLIDKRWAHFHSLVDQVQRHPLPAARPAPNLPHIPHVRRLTGPVDTHRGHRVPTRHAVGLRG
jgi:hypothetical protein